MEHHRLRESPFVVATKPTYKRKRDITANVYRKLGLCCEIFTVAPLRGAAPRLPINSQAIDE